MESTGTCRCKGPVLQSQEQGQRTQAESVGTTGSGVLAKGSRRVPT